jgi:hypothetical protein
MRLLNALCMLCACFLHAFCMLLMLGCWDVETVSAWYWAVPKGSLGLAGATPQRFLDRGKMWQEARNVRDLRDTYETLTKLRSQLKGFIEFIILPHESSANPNWQATHRSLSQQKTNGKNYYFEVWELCLIRLILCPFWSCTIWDVRFMSDVCLELFGLCKKSQKLDVGHSNTKP